MPFHILTSTYYFYLKKNAGWKQNLMKHMVKIQNTENNQNVALYESFQRV